MLTLACTGIGLKRNFAAALFVIVSSVLGTSVLGQEVGQAQFVFGDVVVERGTERIVVQPGTPVQQGDIIRTGADGSLQLIMIDQAFLALRSNSRMRLDRYEFAQVPSASHAALLTLVTGVLRTFTGELARRNRNQFKMRSPIATIGIRGSGNILAHNEETGTLNYTFTGAHSVTSQDEQGVERTLVSYPGQTIQVLPGFAPRFVPTPQFILAVASPPMKSAKAVVPEAGQTTGADNAPAATSSAGGSATAPASGDAAPATAAPPGTSDTGATAAPANTGSATVPPASATAADAPPAAVLPTSSQSLSSATTTVIAPNVGSSQASAATVGASIVAAQPATANGYSTLFRFFNPLSAGGFEGIIGQSSFDANGEVIFDAAGRLVQVNNALVGAFLAGPGSPPPGYNPNTYSGAVSFTGGTHRDGFRSADGSVILGRWEGGTIAVADSSAPGGRASFDLGNRSVSYDVTTPTIGGVLGSFTGSTVYTLAAATAPTDALGRSGSLTTATVSANFSARTITGNFGLNVNGQNFSLLGAAALTPGNPGFTFASSQQTLSVACSGTCASLGYLGTVNGQVAGATGQWMSVSYRVTPNRLPNSGYADYVVGSIALNANTPPTVGIVIPQSGSANLVFSVPPTFLAFGYFGGNINEQIAANLVVGNLQANFTNRTVSFSASIGGNIPVQGPTYQVSAANAPIVGVGFSADTSAQRRPGVGVATVTCSGATCGVPGTTTGRFDGLFTNNSGNAGQLAFTVGDSLGYYVGNAAFGLTTSPNIVAADARSANTAAAQPLASTGANSRMPSMLRLAKGMVTP